MVLLHPSSPFQGQRLEAVVSKVPYEYLTQLGAISDHSPDIVRILTPA